MSNFIQMPDGQARTIRPRTCESHEQRNDTQERMAELMLRIVGFGDGGIHQLPGARLAPPTGGRITWQG